jgi:hypothetical protein
MLSLSQYRYFRYALSLSSLLTAALLPNSVRAGDEAGVTRTYDNSNSPSPWPGAYFDFAWNQYKAECASGGVVVGLSADTSGTLYPHAVYCRSTEVVPLLFAQSTPANPDERDEVFSASNSLDYGHHPINGNADWDYGYYKGECPMGAMVTGIAQSPFSTTRPVDTIHCSTTAGPMCYQSGANFVSTNSCHTVTLPAGGNSYTDWDYNYYKVSCGAHEVVVGVSTDTINQHPHAILCCKDVYSPC